MTLQHLQTEDSGVRIEEHSSYISRTLALPEGRKKSLRFMQRKLELIASCQVHGCIFMKHLR